MNEVFGNAIGTTLVLALAKWFGHEVSWFVVFIPAMMPVGWVGIVLLLGTIRIVFFGYEPPEVPEETEEKPDDDIPE